MSFSLDRRTFVKGAGAVAGLSLVPDLLAAKEKPLFKISLAQWSLHRTLFGRKGFTKLDPLDFPAFTKKTFGIEAVEYVNQFFKDKSKDKKYLGQLKKNCDDNGVISLLIMCDGLGHLGDPDDAKRRKAIENHYSWVEAAKFLGCHSIRVNAHAKGSRDEQRDLAADGLSRLSTFAKDFNINVIVENHGGLSSNGAWLKEVMEKVNMPNCGTLPDFGNFRGYDRYKGVEETMPFAKGVSAKTHKFNDEGYETNTDYEKMMKIVLDAGYRGYVGIEYEGGSKNTEEEIAGIKKTQALLIKMREKFKDQYK